MRISLDDLILSPLAWGITLIGTTIILYWFTLAPDLLWGGGDFEKSICMAVQAGLDTDCNGATVGSIMGMIIGANKVPQRWSSKINNTLHTSLNGNNVLKIDELAQRTFNVYKKISRA